MPEQLLHTADVDTGLQHVRGERMAQRVRRHLLGDAGLCHRTRQHARHPQARVGQVREKSLDLGPAHLLRMAQGMEVHEAAYPLDVALLGL
jgi:hypothetical protein